MGPDRPIAVTLLTTAACAAAVASGCHFQWGWPFLVTSVLLLSFCVAAANFWDKENPRRIHPVCWAFLGLIALHGIQMVPMPGAVCSWLSPVAWGFSEDAGASARPLTASMKDTRDNLVLLVAYMAAFLCGYRLFTRRRHASTLFRGVVLTALALSLYGILLILLRPSDKLFGVAVNDPTRLSSIYTNPDRFCGLLEMAIPMAAALFLRCGIGRRDESRGQEGWRTAFARAFDNPERRSDRFVYGIVLGVLAIAMVLTQSWLGILCFLLAGAVAVAMYAPFLGYRPRLAWVLAGIFAIAAVCLISFGGEIATPDDETAAAPVASYAARRACWYHSLPIVGSHWLLGSGSGTFKYLFAHAQPQGFAGYWRTAHNEYLNILCELGIVGLALFAVGLAMWYRRVVRVEKELDAERLFVTVGVFWGATSVLFHSVAESQLQEPANAFLLCLLAGIGLSMVTKYPQQLPFRSRSHSTSSRKAGVPEWLGVAGWGVAAAVGSLQCYGLMMAQFFAPPAQARASEPMRNLDLESSLCQLGEAAAWDRLYDQALTKGASVAISAAREVIARGDQSGASARMAMARDMIRKAIWLSPVDGRKWYVRGLLAVAESRYEDAAKDMARAVEAAPAYPEPALVAGQYHLFLWDHRGGKAEDLPAAALALLNAAARNDPRYVPRVLALLESHRVPHEKWKESLPETPSAMLKLADALSRLGAFPEAEGILDRLDKTPDPRIRDETAVRRARHLFRRGKADEGVRILTDVLARVPESVREKALGEIYSASADAWDGERTLAAWAKLREALPDDSAANLHYGRALLHANRPAEAVEALRRSIDLKPTSDALSNLAHAYMRMGSYASASDTLDQALLKRPADPSLLLAKAQVCEALGQLDQAVQLYEKLEGLDQSKADTYRQERRRAEDRARRSGKRKGT